MFFFFDLPLVRETHTVVLGLANLCGGFVVAGARGRWVILLRRRGVVNVVCQGTVTTRLRLGIALLVVDVRVLLALWSDLEWICRVALRRLHEDELVNMAVTCYLSGDFYCACGDSILIATSLTR